MDKSEFVNCPLCFSSRIVHFFNDKYRDYYRCKICALVSVPPYQHLSNVKEQAIYDLHENHPEDQRYQKFLSRLAIPLIQRLNTSAEGLDFGCGPGPALSRMLTNEGYKMKNFDPVYANNKEILDIAYDFITCTEVVEHFFHPGDEFSRLFLLLKPNGWLGIMTKMVKDQQAFSTWHYKNDLTHVCFFSLETFQWLARHYRYQLEIIGNDVILMKKT